MPDNKTPLPDGQDQAEVEIQKLKRSIFILSICCFVQAISIGCIFWKIRQIIRVLALFNQNIQLIAQSIDLITQDLYSFYELFVQLVRLL